MIRRIIDFSLDNRLLVVALWLLIAGLGLRAMLELPIDAVPDVTNIQVQVLTNSPGLAPEEVERFITFPVETAMSGLPRIAELRSVSKFGLSVVTVVFAEGTDIYWARQLVSERLTEAREAIPDGYGEPEMGPISTGLGEIYQFEVKAESPCPEGGPDSEACHTPMELRTILDWFVNYQLRSVPGIVEVNSFGGLLKTYQATLDPQSLTSFGLSVGDVLQAVRASNRAVGGGYIAHRGEQYLVRGEGLVENLQDLGDVVLAHDAEGTPVTVADVGEVELAPMIRQGAVTRDGEGEAVVGIVMMLMGESSRVVVDRVKEKIAQIEETLPEGVVIDTYYDRTVVRRTIHTVAKNLGEGGLLVIVVLLLIYLNVPLAVTGGLLALALRGYPFSISAGVGFIALFGIAVLNGVVLISHVVERRRHGATATEAARTGALVRLRPVLMTALVASFGFVPMALATSAGAEVQRPLATVVFGGLVTSTLLTLLVLPTVYSWFTPGPGELGN